MTPDRLNRILGRIRKLSVCVVGDLFLDRYFDIDRGLSDVSLETGREVYHVVRVRDYPGAGGNAAVNLAALGVGRVTILSCIGADGAGLDLKRALDRAGVGHSALIETEDWRTPIYMKRMLSESGRPPHEIERMDIENRCPMPVRAERLLLERLDKLSARTDAVLIADQARDARCGVITPRIRRRIAQLAPRYPKTVFFADSRYRIGEFRNVILKPNRREVLELLGLQQDKVGMKGIRAWALAASARSRKPVFVTLGAQGYLYADVGRLARVPAVRVKGRIDVTGAGDSFSAGAVLALCAGATPEEAAFIGCLVASVVIRQIGVTGQAPPNQLRCALKTAHAAKGPRA